MANGSMALAISPTNTFSRCFALVPIHCKSVNTPFEKWWRPTFMVIAQICASSSCGPINVLHQLNKWSLKTPLWSWWRMLGVMQEKILQWGRLAQKGAISSVQYPSWWLICLQINIDKKLWVHSSAYACKLPQCPSLTVHFGHWLIL